LKVLSDPLQVTAWNCETFHAVISYFIE